MLGLIGKAAAATAFAFLAVGPAAAAPLDIDTTTPILSGSSDDLPDFTAFFGALDTLTLTGASPLGIDAEIAMSVVDDGSGNLFGDFSIDGVDGFSDDPFLSSFDLVSFDFGNGRTTLLFENLIGSGASLFGPQVLITVRERGAGEPGAGEPGPGSNITVENVAPIPLPMTAPLLAAGLGALALVRRRALARG
jgi:hypothetical protein